MIFLLPPAKISRAGTVMKVPTIRKYCSCFHNYCFISLDDTKRVKQTTGPAKQRHDQPTNNRNEMLEETNASSENIQTSSGSSQSSLVHPAINSPSSSPVFKRKSAKSPIFTSNKSNIATSPIIKSRRKAAQANISTDQGHCEKKRKLDLSELCVKSSPPVSGQF